MIDNIQPVNHTRLPMPIPTEIQPLLDEYVGRIEQAALVRRHKRLPAGLPGVPERKLPLANLLGRIMIRLIVVLIQVVGEEYVEFNR